MAWRGSARGRRWPRRCDEKVRCPLGVATVVSLARAKEPSLVFWISPTDRAGFALSSSAYWAERTDYTMNLRTPKPPFFESIDGESENRANVRAWRAGFASTPPKLRFTSLAGSRSNMELGFQTDSGRAGSVGFHLAVHAPYNFATVPILAFAGNSAARWRSTEAGADEKAAFECGFSKFPIYSH